MLGDRIQNKVEKKGTPKSLYLLKQHTLRAFNWVVPLIKKKKNSSEHAPIHIILWIHELYTSTWTYMYVYVYI